MVPSSTAQAVQANLRDQLFLILSGLLLRVSPLGCVRRVHFEVASNSALEMLGLEAACNMTSHHGNHETLALCRESHAVFLFLGALVRARLRRTGSVTTGVPTKASQHYQRESGLQNDAQHEDIAVFDGNLASLAVQNPSEELLRSIDQSLANGRDLKREMKGLLHMA